MYDTLREQLAASSERELVQVQAEWEMDPLRWQSDPDTWPTNMMERPTTEHYVPHHLQEAWVLFDHRMNVVVEQMQMFSFEFLDLWTVMHRVWIKDEHLGALQVVRHQDVDPDLPLDWMPVHDESRKPGSLAPRSVPITQVPVRTMAENLAIRSTMTQPELLQHEAVWAKMDTMVNEVGQFLATKRDLTGTERRGITLVGRQAAAVSNSIEMRAGQEAPAAG